MSKQEQDGARIARWSEGPVTRRDMVTIRVLSLIVFVFALVLTPLGQPLSVLAAALFAVAANSVSMRYKFIDPLRREISRLREELDSARARQ